MPLLVLFCRCLYLAFVTRSPDADRAVTCVPSMASVMYAKDGVAFGTSQIPAMFGATLPYSPLKIHEVKDLTGQKERARKWRLKHVLVAGLKKQQPSACLPLNAKVLSDVARGLHRLIVGTAERPIPKVGHPLHKDLALLTSDIEQRLVAGKTDWAVVKHTNLASKMITKGDLEPLLITVIQRWWELTSL